jgi:hypothetical protein
MKMFRLAARVSIAICVAGSSARAATINVPANGSLQTAVNNAQPGETIALEAGATDTGNFRLPVKNGAMLITIRTAGDADLPGEGGRISPAHAPLLAKIRSGSNAPAFETAIGVRHTAAGIQILGYDNNHPSQQTRDIVVRNNLFADIDSTSWGGNGYFLSLTPWRSAATDGRDLGAPLDGAIGGASANCESATCGVVLIVGTELPSGVVGSRMLDRSRCVATSARTHGRSTRDRCRQVSASTSFPERSRVNLGPPARFRYALP